MIAQPRFLPFGDAALVVEFGDRVDREISALVADLDLRLSAEPPAGLVETTPTFRSLLIAFDPLVADHEEMRAAAQAAMLRPAADGASTDGPRLWTFPVAYGGELGPDLAEVAAETGLAEAAVVQKHLAVEHHVYMLGFLPGAPYLGDLPPEIDLPRRKSPRVAVPAGTVAIAVGLTVIYPVESPGGWRLIGRTPARLFDIAADPPALLRPGDAIRFEQADAATVSALSEAAAAGAWRPSWSPRADV